MCIYDCMRNSYCILFACTNSPGYGIAYNCSREAMKELRSISASMSEILPVSAEEKDVIIISNHLVQSFLHDHPREANAAP